MTGVYLGGDTMVQDSSRGYVSLSRQMLRLAFWSRTDSSSSPFPSPSSAPRWCPFPWGSRLQGHGTPLGGPSEASETILCLTPPKCSPFALVVQGSP